MRVPTRRSEVLAKSKQQNDHYLTPEKIERMKREIITLTKERPALALEMQRTAEEGDFSENAGYQAAKAALRRLNSRIDALNERLRYAIPIQAGVDASGRIRIGCTVIVEMNGKQMTFEIVGSQETSPSRGRISHVSPLGAALLDKKVGDEVTVNTFLYRVIAVT